ncbi:DEAD/DEAH box helicase family protein [Thiothrix subterranea]|uniref:DEAD/DEAH box helicase family protein n=1 Tax=Thiothrix subterranea TaxID=2735563 RepID=UPI00280C0259|nr:DEAD/DEAH box helicase family protein [Thiothrix subterranea]
MSSPQKTFHFWAGSLELENKPAHLLFAKRLEHKFADFHGYLTYRLTNLGRAREEDIPSFLLITKEHGVVAIDVLEERLDAVLVQQDQDFWQLDNGQTILSRSLVLQIYEEEIISRLKNDIRLYDRKTRKLKIPVHSVIVFCKNDDDSLNANSSLSEYAVDVCSLEGFDSYIDSLSTVSCQDEELDKVISLLEGTFIYQQPIRYSVDADPESFNDFIQMSLKTTFKQDDAQRAISMQLPNGPQRIRGLAGTGKTIVLSLKAAITHKKFENFKILYLFNTQSLYSQVQSLITKYYSSEAKKAPDFDGSLHVLHAWGGKARKGLYSELCARYGIIPLGFNEVKGKDSDPLKVIYGDLINKLNSRFEEIYDLVLIDEAQDFPEEVFELIFRITKTVDGKKRIVWAYDEFQSLKDSLINGTRRVVWERCLW